MMTPHKQKVGTVGANPCVRPFIPGRHRGLPLLILFLLLFLVARQAWSSQGYESLLRTMQARQARLEQLLQSPDHCLGEGLDGLLTINASCSDEARMLAQDENQDRQELHRLMAKDLGMSPTEVGERKAKQYVDRYIKGVLRKVRVSASETTWWDGYPPDLRKTAVSRVLALRSAHVLYERPNINSPVVRDNVQQYEAFGVIDSREDSAGERWYQVTEEYVPKIKPRNWSANPLGWIAENKVIPWRRAVVMRFTNSLHREPSLFFATPEPLVHLMKKPDAARKQALLTLRNQLASRQQGTNGVNGVVAVEPQVGTGQERIIMYPILDFKSNLYIGEYQKDARLLQVAARTRNSTPRSRNSAVAIDIIFVMDTTNSMKPYLENVLSATEEFAQAHTDDALRFGFIGYQDKDPQFSYITKEFTSHTLPASEFIHALAQVEARDTPVKGDDIPEAVFEGVNTALDSGQWRQNAIKIIFLVGDAPGREGERINKKKFLRDKGRTRNIRLFAFHLKNSLISKKWDRKSRKQYAELSSVSEGIKGTAQEQSYLRSIDAGATQFRQIMTRGFQEALESLHAVQEYARTGDQSQFSSAEPGSLSELIFQQAALMYADNTLPEEDITGWVCDKVLNNPDREALTPMILLTKNELEELTARVRELKKIGEKSLRGEGGTTEDFFELVTQHTKFTMVDPTAVTFRNAFSVPLGIDKLPYKSEIMNATRSDFQFPDRVQRFVNSMKNKILHYEDLMRKRGDEHVWKKLSAGAPDRDRVVGVELDQLP
ncbi:MAG: DUF1318 domain-containing protein [Candidatus Electrothrix sp. AU1_5]|nr:DUF1318 domain-containing protein [Candidatus Electrothrix gigas]